jgi:hypothetical protein
VPDSDPFFIGCNTRLADGAPLNLAVGVIYNPLAKQPVANGMLPPPRPAVTASVTLHIVGNQKADDFYHQQLVFPS